MLLLIKFFLLLFASLAIFFLPNSPWLLIFFLIPIVIIAISRPNLQLAFRRFLAFLPFIFLTFFFNFWLDSPTSAIWLTVKLALVCLLTILYSLTTTTLAFAHLVQQLLSPLQKFGLESDDIAVLICVSLAMMPIFQREVRELQNACRAKELPLNFRNTKAVLSRFCLNLFARADQLEQALLAKNYPS